MDELSAAVERLDLSVRSYHDSMRTLATRVSGHMRRSKSGNTVQVSGYLRKSLPQNVLARMQAELSHGSQAESYGPAYLAGKDARRELSTEEVQTRIATRVRQRDEAIKQLMESEKRSLLSETLAFNIANHQGYIDGALASKPLFAKSHSFSDFVSGMLHAGVPTTALSATNEDGSMSDLDDAIDTLMNLSSITRVEGYSRRSKSGKKVRVSSYMRKSMPGDLSVGDKVLDAFGKEQVVKSVSGNTVLYKSGGKGTGEHRVMEKPKTPPNDLRNPAKASAYVAEHLAKQEDSKNAKKDSPLTVSPDLQEYMDEADEADAKIVKIAERYNKMGGGGDGNTPGKGWIDPSEIRAEMKKAGIPEANFAYVKDGLKRAGVDVRSHDVPAQARQAMAGRGVHADSPTTPSPKASKAKDGWGKGTLEGMTEKTSGNRTAQVQQQDDGAWTWNVMDTKDLSKGGKDVAGGTAKSESAARAAAEKALSTGMERDGWGPGTLDNLTAKEFGKYTAQVSPEEDGSGKWWWDVMDDSPKGGKEVATGSADSEEEARAAAEKAAKAQPKDASLFKSLASDIEKRISDADKFDNEYEDITFTLRELSQDAGRDFTPAQAKDYIKGINEDFISQAEDMDDDIRSDVEDLLDQLQAFADADGGYDKTKAGMFGPNDMYNDSLPLPKKKTPEQQAAQVKAVKEQQAATRAKNAQAKANMQKVNQASEKVKSAAAKATLALQDTIDKRTAEGKPVSDEAKALNEFRNEANAKALSDLADVQHEMMVVGKAKPRTQDAMMDIYIEGQKIQADAKEGKDIRERYRLYRKDADAYLKKYAVKAAPKKLSGAQQSAANTKAGILPRPQVLSMAPALKENLGIAQEQGHIDAETAKAAQDAAQALYYDRIPTDAQIAALEKADEQGGAPYLTKMIAHAKAVRDRELAKKSGTTATAMGKLQSKVSGGKPNWRGEYFGTGN